MARRTAGWMTGAAAAAAALAAVSGCGGADSAAAPPAPAEITVTSTAFQDDGTIPDAYTCSGSNTVPALSWSGVPADAGWLALVVDDPSAPGGTYHHWYVVQIPPGTRGVAEGGAAPGRAVVGWKAPCPPPGSTDTYEFSVYALPKGYQPTKLGAIPVYDLTGLEAHAVGKGTLSATATGK